MSNSNQIIQKKDISTPLSLNFFESFFMFGFTRVSNKHKILAVEIFGYPVRKLLENLALNIKFVSIRRAQVT